MRLPSGVVEAKVEKDQTILPQGLELAYDLPQTIELAFCPTGPGGGVDNSCSSSEGGGGGGYSGANAKALKGLDDNIAKAIKMREKAKAGIKAAKASGDKKALSRYRKLRAQANKQIEAYQQEKVKLGGKAEHKTYQKVKAAQKKIAKMPAGPEKTAAISENAKSVPTVKGEAAKTTFNALGVVTSSCCIDPEMKTTKGMQSAVRRQFADFHEQLGAGETNALLSYSGVGYTSINQGLRDSKGTKVTARIAKMDDAFAKAPALEQDIVVARGTSSGGGRWAKLKTGDVFQDHGFVSTSVNSGKAFSGSTQIKIRVPKGSKGIFMNELLSEHSNEREYLLPRSSKFRITGVEVNNAGVRNIQMEYIHNG